MATNLTQTIDSEHSQNGWLNRIRLGLVDYDRHLFLAQYDL